MKSSPSGFQWAILTASWAILTALISYPRTLPGPIRSGVETSVDATARVFLWAWDEPTDLLDLPPADWPVGAPSARDKDLVTVTDSHLEDANRKMASLDRDPD